jgi:hypothetical protein
MKIKLNADETYEIKLPEEVGIEQLAGLVSRFSSLLKNFSRNENITFNTSNKIRNTPANYSSHASERKLLHENRDVVVKLWKAYYSEDRKEFEKLRSELGLDNYLKNKYWMTSGTGRENRERHKITPQEVGIKKFPAKGESVERLK